MPYFEVQLTPKLHRIFDVQHDMTIGRAPQCGIQLLSRAVSRRHARVEFSERGEAVISDMGTKNGIKLNGRRVEGAAVVRDGDRVHVGDVKMVFRTSSFAPGLAHTIDLRGRAIQNEDVIAAQQPYSSFVLPAHADQINAFTSLVGRARVETLDFDDLTQLKLQIALKEALDNARIHGCQNDFNKGMEVIFHDGEEEFRMSVRDSGPGYDVNSVLSRVTEVDAMQAIRDRPQLGPGLGLRIILNCVDRLQFEGGGTTIHMARFKSAQEVYVLASDMGGTPEAETEEHLLHSEGFDPGAPTFVGAPPGMEQGPGQSPFGGAGADPFAVDPAQNPFVPTGEVLPDPAAAAAVSGDPFAPLAPPDPPAPDSPFMSPAPDPFQAAQGDPFQQLPQPAPADPFQQQLQPAPADPFQGVDPFQATVSQGPPGQPPLGAVPDDPFAPLAAPPGGAHPFQPASSGPPPSDPPVQAPPAGLASWQVPDTEAGTPTAELVQPGPAGSPSAGSGGPSWAAETPPGGLFEDPTAEAPIYPDPFAGLDSSDTHQAPPEPGADGESPSPGSDDSDTFQIGMDDLF